VVVSSSLIEYSLAISGQQTPVLKVEKYKGANLSKNHLKNHLSAKQKLVFNTCYFTYLKKLIIVAT